MARLETPILFLVFNRPTQTQRVFEAIRQVRPTRLFIAADGPRQNKVGEAELCHRTRAITAAIDWPCQVEKLFRKDNLGCGAAVSGAIRWFFDHVEEGIILEDDCLPHPDFFPFCESLLARYRHEPRVATIAGTHFLPPELTHARTHYVSKYFQMWGWASWRRTWDTYDFSLEGLSAAAWFELLKHRHPIAAEAGYWIEIFKGLSVGGIDTWDFQVLFSSWRQGANHVMPGRNLISNIGFGHDATHTAFASPMSNLPIHPLRVAADEEVPLEPDPVLDNIIFYLRFLESMTHTWWVEQVLAPDRKLSEARTELMRREKLIRTLETERHIQRRQLRAATQALASANAILSSRRTLLRHLVRPSGMRPRGESLA